MSQNQEIIESKLCAYIDGELDPEGRAEIEKHLEANPQHRRLLESLRATRDLIRWLPREPAPPEVAETLSGQLERSVLLNYEGDSLRVSPWPRIFAAAAIVLLTAGLGIAVYYALPKSQKPAQLAIHSQSSDTNTGDIVPAPPEPEGRPELATTAEADRGEADKMRAATPEDLRKDGSAADSKLADESRPANSAVANNTDNYRELDQLAQQVGQNPSAFLSEAANSNNVLAQKAAPSNPGAMVLLVRSNAPEQTEKQLTSYLNQQQIQWRQPAVVQQSDAAQQRQQGGWGFSTDAAKKLQAQKGGAVGQLQPAAVASAPPPATQPAQNELLADKQNVGLSQQAAIAPPTANSIPSNAVFVCQMSRRQAEQLSNSIGNESLAGAQVQNVNGFAYNNSLDRNPTQNAAGESAADQAANRRALGGGAPADRLRTFPAQTEPASAVHQSVETKMEVPVPPTTQPAASSSVALNSAAPAPAGAVRQENPTTQPGAVPTESEHAGPGPGQLALGTTVPSTSPTDEPVNVVIMVQPNVSGPASASTPSTSTQPVGGPFPQKAQATPAPQPQPALK